MAADPALAREPISNRGQRRQSKLFSRVSGVEDILRTALDTYLYCNTTASKSSAVSIATKQQPTAFFSAVEARPPAGLCGTNINKAAGILGMCSRP